jgi:hypothetical protein
MWIQNDLLWIYNYSTFHIIPDLNLDPTLEVGRVKKIPNEAAGRPPNASFRKSKKNLKNNLYQTGSVEVFNKVSMGFESGSSSNQPKKDPEPD